MEKVILSIDEDLSDHRAVALRSRGFDVVSTHEINIRGKSDSEQLEYLIKHERVILTMKKHFVNL